MNRDISLEKLPKGESPYMLNVNPMEDFGVITNELGTDVDVSLPSGYNFLGDILLDDNRRVIFAYNSTSNLSGIYLKDADTLTAIIPPTALLGFSLLHQIEGVFKRNYRGEYVIYWTDNFNVPRTLNINNPLTLTADNISLLNIFNSYIKPTFSLSSVSLGGNLKSGVYQFFVQYEDVYGNKTDITGASNFVSVTPSTGDMKPFKYSGAPANTSTNKKISMVVNDIDTNYSKVYVISQFYNNGVAAIPKQFAEFAINGSSVSFDFTGNETVTEIAVGEILSLYAKYATAKTITTFSNTLYLANLTSNPDLGLQKYVNSIGVSYAMNPTDVTNNDTSFNNEVVIYNNKGFMQDDVYALYISYVLRDGSQTKAYHIPGRPALNISKYSTGASSPAYPENTLISTVKANWAYPAERTLPDSALDEAIAVSPTAKWYQFFGTEDNANTFAWGTSQLGYWENENETYPNTDDWDIYSLDANGNGVYRDTLKTKKVRHHKMPEPEIKNSASSKYLDSGNVGAKANVVALQLTNIPIPANVKNKIAGYKIYYAKKDQKNTLVLAQDVAKFNATNNTASGEKAWAVAGGNNYITNSSSSPTVNYFDFPDFKSFRIHDFNTLKNNLDISTASWVKSIGGIEQVATTVYVDSPSGTLTQFAISSDYTNTVSSGHTTNWKPSTDATWKTRTTEYIRKIKSIFYLSPNAAKNSFSGNKASYNTTKDVHNWAGESSIFIEVLNNYSQTPFNIGNGLADSFHNDSILLNVMAYLTDVHNSFDNQELVECAYNTVITEPAYTVGTFITQGDTFFGINTYRVATNIGDLTADGLSPREVDIRHNYVVPHLSRVNVLFRHQGLLDTEVYYPKTYYNSGVNFQFDTGKGVLELPLTIDNYRAYNNDYSRGNTIYQPEIIQKGIVADNNLFSTRIIRSNNASNEAVEDAFKQFPAGNYKDLDKDRGQIEVLKKDSMALIIHLTNAITKTIARDVLKTDTTVAYIGNGDIFEIPTREIKYTDIGFGGTQSQWANIVTPSGYIYPDIKNRRIMNFGQGLDAISDNGMITFFQENMNFKLVEQFPDVPISQDNNANPNGIGYTAAWDNINRRYLLTKRDYSMNPELFPSYVGVYDVLPFLSIGSIIFYTATSTFQKYGYTGWEELPFSNTQYWIDESFTIGYYPDFKSWFSFYDYKPLAYIYDHNQFWGVNSNVIWKHNTGTRGSFYGNTYNTILDVPFNEQGDKSKIFDNVQFISKYVLNNVESPDKTYDSYNIYSSNGLSGETSFSGHSRFINGTWYVNDFRDMRADYNTPLLDGWNIVGVTNPNKNKLFKKRFFDNYIVLRLKYENNENAKVGLIFNSAKARIKER